MILLLSLLLSYNCCAADIIQHIAAASLVDIDAANPRDHCSVNFFRHNESYTEKDDATNETYTFTSNDAYFFLSWTHLNDRGYWQIVGNIYNVENPYVPIGALNDSFLSISPYNNDGDDGNNNNYHYVSTSDFRSKPDDIVFSFYNENRIEIHVFGSTKSHFYGDTFLWSPEIPIIAKENNASIYNIIHQNIECIDGIDEESIVFVYEEKYMVNGNTEYTNIYKSTFNNRYVVSHDSTPINSIKGIISTPLVSQSLRSTNLIISYIANYRSIRYKLYSIALEPIKNETIIVSASADIKYYNMIPLSIGGYIIMYCVHHNAIYTTLMNENGETFFVDDAFIDNESNNTLNHGQIIELKGISDSETYIMMSFVKIGSDGRDKMMAIVYNIDIAFDPPHFEQKGNMIELNSFPNNDEFVVHPHYQCINYDEMSNTMVIAWLNNYSQYSYKLFRIQLPTTTTTTTQQHTTTTATTPLISTKNDIELSLISHDAQIILIVLCVAAFYCCFIVMITFVIIYMVHSGKLRFAIGYKQIHKQNQTKEQEEEDNDDLELGDDQNGALADDEHSVDEDPLHLHNNR